MNQPQAPSAKDLSATQRFALMRRAQEALRRDPKNVEALLAMASVQGAENNLGAAVETLKKALAARKKDPDILRRLISAAQAANDLASARKYGRKLTEVEPKVAENHRIYAQVTATQGFPDAAIRSYLTADRLEPGSAQTLHAIGHCYALTGEHDKAMEFYEKALAADPTFSMVLYSYSMARKFSADEVEAFLAKLEHAISLAQDASAEAYLQFAAGKVLDDAGRHDAAFDWFEKANALQRPENQTLLPASFANSTEAFTREFFIAKSDYGSRSDQPVFILGMPRSGTTLTESFCAAHSKVTAGDELIPINTIAKRLGRDSDLGGAYKRNLEALSKPQVEELAQEYLSQCKSAAGNTPHFTDKLPHNFMNVGLIALIFPEARIIHCRRHPLDTCLSLYTNATRPHHNRYKTDLTRLGVYYRQYLKLMEHWRTVLPGRMYEVHYEDMVSNPEWNARAIIDHLGLDWEDGVMERTGSQRSVKTLSRWQVRQPVYQSSSGKWRRYEKHLGPLIEALGPSIEAYDKELEALDQRHVEAAEAGDA